MPAKTTQQAAEPVVEAVGVRPELADLAVPIKKLKLHPKNARRHDLDRLKQSLGAHGQYVPVLVQLSTGFVIKGNGTLLAAKELKWKEVAAQYLDLTDKQALAILAADNKASDESGYHEDQLADLLSELSRGGDLEAALFTQSELDVLLSSLDHSEEVAESMGAIGSMSTEGARNPLESASPPDDDDPSVPLIFYLLPDERDEVRSRLATTGEVSISDQLLAVMRTWAPRS